MNAFVRPLQDYSRDSGSTRKDLLGIQGTLLVGPEALSAEAEYPAQMLTRLGYRITRESQDHWVLRLADRPLEIHLYSPAELVAFARSRAETYATGAICSQLYPNPRS